MIPLFFAALVDTVVAPTAYETVHVHEWGVVVFDEQDPAAVGVPGDYAWYPPVDLYYGDDYCVEAPVVWFHGAPCSGTFSVYTPEGWLTELYPEPDRLDGLLLTGSFLDGFEEMYDRAFWDITIGSVEPASEDLREWDTGLSYEWAAGFWREVPAEYLYRESDGFCDRFIYYECGMPRQWNDFLSNGDGSITFRNGFDGEGIVIVTGSLPGYAPVRARGEVTVPSMDLFVPAERDSITAILSGWAGGMLKESEISALWSTWEGTVFAGPGSWLLFPLPPDAVSRISTIEFVPDECFVEVRYERLFLGLVRIGD